MRHLNRFSTSKNPELKEETVRAPRGSRGSDLNAPEAPCQPERPQWRAVIRLAKGGLRESGVEPDLSFTTRDILENPE